MEIAQGHGFMLHVSSFIWLHLKRNLGFMRGSVLFIIFLHQLKLILLIFLIFNTHSVQLPPSTLKYFLKQTFPRAHFVCIYYVLRTR